MQPLQPDTSYHIFNHANGFENVFREAENYLFFSFNIEVSPAGETSKKR
jgi:putative transposase